MDELITVSEIKNLIYEVRGHKVMLDSDLAKLYKVKTMVLNQAVKRNLKRFPEDFMFQLTQDEFSNLISQNVISRWGGVRKMPYVFTEQGIAMLSGLLNSDIAISINIHIMRTFVHMRQFALENKELAVRLNKFEKYLIQHAQDNNAEFKELREAIGLLMDRTKPKKIGF